MRSKKQKWASGRNWFLLQLAGMQTVVQSQRHTGNNYLSGQQIGDLADALLRAELHVRNSLYQYERDAAKDKDAIT